MDVDNRVYGIIYRVYNKEEETDSKMMMMRMMTTTATSIRKQESESNGKNVQLSLTHIYNTRNIYRV
jgi:hypothetical protein